MNIHLTPLLTGRRNRDGLVRARAERTGAAATRTVGSPRGDNESWRGQRSLLAITPRRVRNAVIWVSL